MSKNSINTLLERLSSIEERIGRMEGEREALDVKIGYIHERLKGITDKLDSKEKVAQHLIQQYPQTPIRQQLNNFDKLLLALVVIILFVILLVAMPKYAMAALEKFLNIQI